MREAYLMFLTSFPRFAANQPSLLSSGLPTLVFPWVRMAEFPATPAVATACYLSPQMVEMAKVYFMEKKLELNFNSESVKKETGFSVSLAQGSLEPALVSRVCPWAASLLSWRPCSQ